MMKKQKVVSQMKGQDKTPEKQPKWSGAEKRISEFFWYVNDDSDNEDDPGSWEKNGGKDWEEARNVYQRPTRNKEKTNKQREIIY